MLDARRIHAGFITLCAATALTTTACASQRAPSVHADEDVLQALSSIGIASFSLSEGIRAGTVGPLVGLQSNEWGRGLLSARYVALREALNLSLGGALVDDDRVTSHPTYRKLPAREGSWASAHGQRPLRSDDADLRALGDIAAGAGVDAVAVFRSKLSVRAEKKNSLQQFVCSEFGFELIDKNGIRIWKQAGGVKSASMSTAAALIGASTEDDAQKMGEGAVIRSLDEIDRHLVHARDGTPLRSQKPLGGAFSFEIDGGCF